MRSRGPLDGYREISWSARENPGQRLIPAKSFVTFDCKKADSFSGFMDMACLSVRGLLTVSAAVAYDEITAGGRASPSGNIGNLYGWLGYYGEGPDSRIGNCKRTLAGLPCTERHRPEEEIMKQLDALRFNANVGSNE